MRTKAEIIADLLDYDISPCQECTNMNETFSHVTMGENKSERQEYADTFNHYYQLDGTIEDCMRRRRRLERFAKKAKAAAHGLFARELDLRNRADYAERQRIAELDKQYKIKPEPAKVVKLSDFEKLKKTMMETMGMSEDEAVKKIQEMKGIG